MASGRIDRRSVGERLEALASLDRIVAPLGRLAHQVLPKGDAKDALHGTWLGHPLHPMLTDLPIGFWTSAVVLDLLGGRRTEQAAEVLLAAGVVTAAPTALTGWTDWSELNRPEQRSGFVHAAANVSATVLFTASLLARRRGHRTGGIALGLAGSAAATVGGYLGGHLAYRRASGVNQNALAPAPDDWADADRAASADGVTVVLLDGTEILVVAGADEAHAVAARCAHLGGPLAEGEIEGGCVTCPWHGSRFRLADGALLRGPATAPLPAYDVDLDGDRVRLRRRSLTGR
ncbi:MAG: iron-sulfur protein [Acidimicrobiales bacterium]|nr:iron-sulfur protein [Acidimicrobiales bacterium]